MSTKAIIHAPGIYFGLPEAEYHADPALSASGIKDLLISPLDFWTRSPMNPDYKREETDAMTAGTAFHRRLLEPERFASLYAAIPTKADYPDAVDGVEALRALCEQLDLKKSGKISEMCERILEADPTAQLWPVIQAQLLEELDGKILLKPDLMADIERAARIIFAHSAAAKAFTGGYAEVSIFWLDKETGIRMKCRVDYLKTKAIVDAKTFNNSRGRPIDVAVAGAVAEQAHHVQAVVYDAGVAAAREMLIREKSAIIHHIDGALPSTDWLVNFAACENHTFVFVFIEQGRVTNVRVRECLRFERGAEGASANQYWQSGHTGFRKGVQLYQEYMERYGPDREWIEDAPMRAFRDEEMPVWMLSR